jgi:hypothetical protein
MAKKDEKGFIHYTPEELAQTPSYEERAGGQPSIGGGILGAVLGTVGGAAIGSTVGPTGTVLGGVTGGVVGGAAGSQAKRTDK